VGANLIVPLTGVNQLVRTGSGTLEGWSIRETAAAVASVRLRDGTTAAGSILAVVGLVASGGQTVPDVSIRFATGLYVEVVAGAVEGAIWLE
jgi:hypothetical protein